jgi:uncharacterized protein YkwD
MTRTTRRRSLAGLLVAAALLLAGCLTGEQQTVLDELNADRQAAGLAALPANDPAVAKAQAWAEKLARDNALSHSNLAAGLEGLCWRAIGENVGYGGSIAQVEDGYMGSSGHRANILNPRWDVVGVGYATTVVSGRTRVFTVQVFVDLC